MDLKLDTRIRRFVALAMIVSPIKPVVAHHSVVQFDMAENHIVTIEGEVIEWDWRNPHVFIRVEAPDENGDPQEWIVEGQGISNLLPRGLNENSARRGDIVTLLGNPNKNPRSRTMNGVAIMLENDRMYALGSVVPDFIAEQTELDPDKEFVTENLSGVWLPQNGFYMQNFQTEDWTLTTEAEETQAAFDGTQIPQAECIPVPPPRLTLWPVVHEIEVEDDIVIIRSDWMNAERRIYLDGRDHLGNENRDVLGHSIGNWEDDSLVVKTENFAYAQAGTSWGVPSGEQKSLTEKFSLADDQKTIHYEYTISDPEYLNEPVFGEAFLSYRPDLEPSGVECDVENSSRFLYEE